MQGPLMNEKFYRDYNTYLRETFGCRVQKISIDAGLTCPNRDGALGTGGCIYCNERGSGTGAWSRAQSIAEQMSEGKSYLSRRYKAKRFLAYFQSYTNTYAPLPRLEAIFGEALAQEDVVGLTIGTRPDCLPDEVLDYLAALSRHHLIWLELGLQSAHDQTLELIRRGHSVAAFDDALKRSRSRGLPVCVHVILGLPGESREHMLATARYLASRDIQAVKLHLLYVVKGTVLADWYRSGRYVCLTREEYASLVGDFITLLPPRVIIQRLTGDPHPEELEAPAWALEKQRNLEAIHSYMKEHSLYQGKAYRS